MDGRRLKPISLNDSARGPDLNSRLQSPSEVVFNVIRTDVANGPLTKRLLEVQGRTSIRFVRLFGSDRWLGVVLQEKVRPIRELVSDT
jgi:hypothetical protein